VKQIPEQLLQPAFVQSPELAAQEQPGREVTVVEKEDGTEFGKLRYSYREAALVLEVEQEGFDPEAYYIELVMNDGHLLKTKPVKMRDKNEVYLLKDSKYGDKDVKEIRFIPKDREEKA